MPESAPSTPTPAHAPRRRSPLGIIFLTLFLDLAGFSIIFPLSPDLLAYYLDQEGRTGILGGIVEAIEALHPSAAERPVYLAALFGGVLGSLYSFLQFLFSPFWGSLSDRTGRRPILLISNTGIALSYLLWAFSGSFTMFIVSRLLAGAMGGNISVATAAAADASSRADRAKAMGIVGAAFGLGFICGPALGGALASIDLSARFPSLAAYGLNPFSAPALGAFLLSLLSVAWVATRFQETLPPEARGRSEERRTINPARFFRRFEFPGVRAVNVITFLYLLAFSGMEFTLTFLAKERLGYGPRENLWLFVYVGLILVLVQGGLVRRLAPRLGERRMAALGLATVLPGFIIIGLAGSAGVLYLGLTFMAFGSGLINPATSALVSLYTPPDRQGGVLGIFRSVGTFARAVGPLLASLLFWSLSPAAPYLLGAAVLVPTLLLVLRLPAPGGRE